LRASHRRFFAPLRMTANYQVTLAVLRKGD
jgi:hypothetical protein